MKHIKFKTVAAVVAVTAFAVGLIVVLDMAVDELAEERAEEILKRTAHVEEMKKAIKENDRHYEQDSEIVAEILGAGAMSKMLKASKAYIESLENDLVVQKAYIFGNVSVEMSAYSTYETALAGDAWAAARDVVSAAASVYFAQSKFERAVHEEDVDEWKRQRAEKELEEAKRNLTEAVKKDKELNP